MIRAGGTPLPLPPGSLPPLPPPPPPSPAATWLSRGCPSDPPGLVFRNSWFRTRRGSEQKQRAGEAGEPALEGRSHNTAPVHQVQSPRGPRTQVIRAPDPALPSRPLVFHLPFLHHLLLRRQFGSVLAVLRTHQSATSARARVWRRPWKCTRRERPLSCTVPAWSAVYPRATTATTWRGLLGVLRA